MRLSQLKPGTILFQSKLRFLLVSLRPFPKENKIESQTYISANSTFVNFKLEYGNLVINNDGFAVGTAYNNKLGGVHRDGCRVVANGEDKVFICSAL